MKFYRVKTPSGGVVQVPYEPGLTDDQILARAREIDTEKDRAGAYTRPSMREEMGYSGPNPLERMGRGFVDFGQAVKQSSMLLSPDPNVRAAEPEYRRRMDDESALYEKGRGQDAGSFDSMRFLGGTLPTMAALAFAPEFTAAKVLVDGTKASSPMWARSLEQGIKGAATSLAVPAFGDTSKVQQAVVGGGAGAAVPPVADVVSRIGSWLSGKGASEVKALLTSPQKLEAQIQVEMGPMFREMGVDWTSMKADARRNIIEQARRQIEVHGSLNPEALARKADIDSLDPRLLPTRGQVTRDPAEWTFERNMSKPGVPGDPGEALRGRFTDQIGVLRERAEKLRAATGGVPGTEYEAGKTLVDTLRKRATDRKRLVDDMYDLWRGSGAGATEVKAQGVADTFGKVVEEFGESSINPDVRAKLAAFGFADGKQTKLFTVEEAEKLRRLVSNTMPRQRSPTDAAHARILQAIDDSVLATEAPDLPLLKNARGAAAQGFAERRSSAAIEAAADDSTQPDKFFQRYVVAGTVKDLSGLKAALNSGVTGAKAPGGTDLAEPLGAQAWRDLKSRVVQNLLDAAEDAKVGFSGARFGDALEKIPKEKLNVLFEKPEIDALRQLARVSRALTTDTPYSAVNYSNTAPAGAGIIGSFLDFIPGGRTAGRVVGGLSELGDKAAQDAILRGRISGALSGDVANVERAADARRQLANLISGRISRFGTAPLAGLPQTYASDRY